MFDGTVHSVESGVFQNIVSVVWCQGRLSSAARWVLERLPQQAVPGAGKDRVLQKSTDGKCLPTFIHCLWCIVLFI